MLTLLGSLLGFAGSLVPEMLRNFQDRRDKAHELEILKLQLEQQKTGHAAKMEAINLERNIRESESLYKTFYSGNHSTDRLNSVVRPVIALGFFGLYFLLKLLIFCSVHDICGSSFTLIYNTLWTAEDAAIFAGIISFYFGNRAMVKRGN